jgi:hypothetical protein
VHEVKSAQTSPPDCIACCHLHLPHSALLLLLFLKELGDGKLLVVCCCLDLPACAEIGVAADASIPCPVLVRPPAASQLLVAVCVSSSAPVKRICGDARKKCCGGRSVPVHAPRTLRDSVSAPGSISDTVSLHANIFLIGPSLQPSSPAEGGFPAGALRYHSSTVVGRSLKATNPGPSVESRKLRASSAVASGANGTTTRTAIPQCRKRLFYE